MPDEVLAKGKLIKPDGSAWAGVPVTCTFVGFSTTPTTQHPPAKQTTITAADGTYWFLLWRNQLGDYASHYLFKYLNDKAPRKAIVTIDTPAEVEISQLLLASTDPGDPTYPSLIALINELFANGNFAGSADIIPLNPAIPGLGATVQTAIAAQQQRLLVEAPFTLNFTQADLSIAGILPVVHNKNTILPSVKVWDGVGAQINPDAIIPQGADAVGVDLQSYTPLTGIWKLKVEE